MKDKNSIDFKPTGKRGRKPYDLEKFYRWLYKNSDHRGIVIYTQRDVAKLTGISYQRVNYIYKDLCETGHLKQHPNMGRAGCYEVVYDPDYVDWGEPFQERQSELRKLHQTVYRDKLKKENNDG